MRRHNFFIGLFGIQYLTDPVQPVLFYKNLCNSLILLFKIFKTLSNPNRKSQGAEILRECSPPHQVPHVTFHVSHVTCHMSQVRCHVSPFFMDKVVELVGRGSVINGAYPFQFLDEYIPPPQNVLTATRHFYLNTTKIAETFQKQSTKKT